MSFSRHLSPKFILLCHKIPCTHKGRRKKKAHRRRRRRHRMDLHIGLTQVQLLLYTPHRLPASMCTLYVNLNATQFTVPSALRQSVNRRSFAAKAIWITFNSIAINKTVVMRGALAAWLTEWVNEWLSKRTDSGCMWMRFTDVYLTPRQDLIDSLLPLFVFSHLIFRRIFRICHSSHTIESVLSEWANVLHVVRNDGGWRHYFMYDFCIKRLGEKNLST